MKVSDWKYDEVKWTEDILAVHSRELRNKVTSDGSLTSDLKFEDGLE